MQFTMGQPERRLQQLTGAAFRAYQTLMGNEPRQPIDGRTLTWRKGILLAYVTACVAESLILRSPVIGIPTVVGAFIAGNRYLAGLGINRELKAEKKL